MKHIKRSGVAGTGSLRLRSSLLLLAVVGFLLCGLFLNASLGSGGGLFGDVSARPTASSSDANEGKTLTAAPDGFFFDIPVRSKVKPNPQPEPARQQAAGQGQQDGAPTYEPASCPDDALWLQPWLEYQLEGRLKSSTQQAGERQRRQKPKPMVLVDVGANKGYTLAAWLSIIGQKLSSSGSAVARNILANLAGFAAAHNIKRFCGNCCDCLEEFPVSGDEKNSGAAGALGVNRGGGTNTAPGTTGRAESEATTSSGSPHAQLFGFEGLPSNAQFLRRFFNEWTGASLVKGASVTVVEKAVGSRTGVAKFEDVPVGSEVGGFAHPEGAAPTTEVTVTTLDNFFLTSNESGLPPLSGGTTNSGQSRPFEEPLIDVLLTDVEGSDVEVYGGTQQLLARQAIGIYVFELWAPAKQNRWMLRQLTFQYGFACFFPLQGLGYTPQDTVPMFLSFEDYQELTASGRKPFAIHGWGNAICIHTKHNAPLVELLRELGSRRSSPLVRPNKLQVCPVQDAFLTERRLISNVAEELVVARQQQSSSNKVEAVDTRNQRLGAEIELKAEAVRRWIRDYLTR